MVTPAQRREAVAYLEARYEVIERRASRFTGGEGKLESHRRT